MFPTRSNKPKNPKQRAPHKFNRAPHKYRIAANPQTPKDTLTEMGRARRTSKNRDNFQNFTAVEACVAPPRQDPTTHRRQSIQIQLMEGIVERQMIDEFSPKVIELQSPPWDR